MQHRKWRFTLKQRMGLCLAAFFAAFAMQLALNGYQSRAVQAVQDAQMGSFNAISRFQGGVESSISVLENYRWENSETDAHGTASVCVLDLQCVVVAHRHQSGRAGERQ